MNIDLRPCELPVVGLGVWLLVSEAYGQTPPADAGSSSAVPASQSATAEGTAIEDWAARTSGRAHPGEAAPGEPPQSERIEAANFVQRGMQEGLVQIQLANLALSRSGNKAVLEFASRIKEEQVRVASELHAVAAHGRALTAFAMDGGHQGTIESVSNESGPAFDEAYAAANATAEAAQLDLFKAGVASSDAEVAQLAAKEVSSLEEHRSQADALVSTIRIANGGSKQTYR